MSIYHEISGETSSASKPLVDNDKPGDMRPDAAGPVGASAAPDAPKLDAAAPDAALDPPTPPSPEPAAESKKAVGLSGEAAYRYRPWMHDMPVRLWSVLGDPPVLEHHLRQFWDIWLELARECERHTLADWVNLWDQTVLRVEISQIGRAKAATVGLYYDRAAKEINRPGGLRFLERDPYKEVLHDFNRPAADVEADEPPPDYDNMRSELERLHLPYNSASDLAYVLAAPRLEPVEVSLAVKQTQSRQLREEFQRRQERAEQARLSLGHDDATEAEFEPVDAANSGASESASRPDTALKPDLASQPSTDTAQVADERSGAAETPALQVVAASPASDSPSSAPVSEAAPNPMKADADGDLF